MLVVIIQRLGSLIARINILFVAEVQAGAQHEVDDARDRSAVPAEEDIPSQSHLQLVFAQHAPAPNEA